MVGDPALVAIGARKKLPDEERALILSDPPDDLLRQVSIATRPGVAASADTEKPHSGLTVATGPDCSGGGPRLIAYGSGSKQRERFLGPGWHIGDSTSCICLLWSGKPHRVEASALSLPR